MSRDWTHSLFDCFSPFSTCLYGSFIPCILYGQITEKQNNPNMSPSGFNGSCFGWYCLSCCGLQCILQMGTRREIRERYGIAGSGAEDFFISWCCCCCGLIQEHKEQEAMQNNVPVAAGGQYGVTGQQGYAAPQQPGMVYQKP